MEQIRIAGIRWSLYDQRTWLGEAGDMVYTIKTAVCGWVLEAGGVKEIYPTLESAKKRALQDYRIRSERMMMTMGPKYREYDENIGGV
ncbi:hypothetical protein [uncultured Porphyromonas sp.]|uniref:hypothetical protein n=1 Tax=uncultured Porphyromonas sp. TaxID=159274 RepID=UPI00262A12A9|nr:hypothetical protein [uncultured Porphyromonas sp.]